MATVSPSNFKFVNASGDDGEVKSLSDADITLINNCLQDVENLKYTALSSLPSGSMIHFAGNVVPAGFLVCNGAAVSRTDYANLFTAIGTLYGAGDGSTTFNLPDARDRVLQGASSTYAVGTSIAAGLPNITGSIEAWSYNSIGGVTNSGAITFFEGSLMCLTNIGPVTRNERGFSFNANNSNSIYSASNTVQSPAVAAYILIKI